MMKRLLPLFLLAVSVCRGGPVLDQLQADFARIRTVTCEVERVTEGKQGQIKLLSRVFYQEGGRLHVENFKPGRRRIVMDGTRLFLKDEAFTQGFSGPIATLRDQDFWRDQIERIPGTASDHVRRAIAQKLEEAPLPAAEGLARRTGFQAEKTYLVLGQDQRGRILRVEYFKDATLSALTARFVYTDFKEFADGVAIAQTHRGEVHAGADVIQETTRFLNLEANQPVPAGMFDPKLYFKGVEFADDFGKMK